MSKKARIIVIACIAGGLVLATLMSVWATGYALIKGRINNAEYRATVDIMWEYVQDDEYFEEQYGKPTDYEPCKKTSREILGDRVERISFFVSVESGETYLVTMDWHRVADESFEYHSVKLQK